MTAFSTLVTEIRVCTKCAPQLPLGARPVFQVHPQARILIAGQAPGRKVHESGVPFDDASGNRLREWMGITREIFYAKEISILPMGFCYPGTGKSGDLPPRPECEVSWRGPLLSHLKNLQLTLVIGKYAQDYHLPSEGKTLTESVMAWRDNWPIIIPLPHPSPRNNIWLKRNPWFEKELLPVLKGRIADVLCEKR